MLGAASTRRVSLHDLLMLACEYDLSISFGIYEQDSFGCSGFIIFLSF